MTGRWPVVWRHVPGGSGVSLPGAGDVVGLEASPLVVEAERRTIERIASLFSEPEFREQTEAGRGQDLDAALADAVAALAGSEPALGRVSPGVARRAARRMRDSGMSYPWSTIELTIEERHGGSPEPCA